MQRQKHYMTKQMYPRRTPICINIVYQAANTDEDYR